MEVRLIGLFRELMATLQYVRTLESSAHSNSG